jgi:DNA-binding transcriptional ArsR family regulator
MCTAEEKFFTPLSASEYRLLDVLCLLSKNNVVEVPMEKLASYVQSSEESVRRALRKLEQVNLVETVRRKRNLGKLSNNVYELISPSHKNVVLPPHENVELGEPPHNSPPHKNVGSTADIDIAITTSNDLITNKTTSYLVPKGTKRRKEFKVIGRWSEEEEIGGFGLFDNELADKTPSAKVSKRDPKTRNLRPQEEWTAADVASEFAFRLYKAIPGVPNLVNTNNVRGALARMRKQFDSNALIELEVMKMFFEDPWVQSQGKDKPAFLAGRFLKMFANNFDQALRNLGLPPRQGPSEKSVSSTPRVEFLYASDGEQFDNSMPGRLALERYEESLRRTTDV